MIISPCISICKTDPTTGYCYGCGRSNDEKRLRPTRLPIPPSPTNYEVLYIIETICPMTIAKKLSIYLIKFILIYKK